MREIILGSASGVLVFCQAGTADGLGTLAPYVNAGAVAVVLALVWYLVTKAQPRERKEAQEHTERVVARVCEQFAATQELQHKDTIRISSSIESLASNCAVHLQSKG